MDTLDKATVAVPQHPTLRSIQEEAMATSEKTERMIEEIFEALCAESKPSDSPVGAGNKFNLLTLAEQIKLSASRVAERVSELKERLG